MLNKLGGGFINVDEGSEVKDELLNEEKKEEKKNEEKNVNKKAHLFSAIMKKKFKEEDKNKQDSPKNDFSKEGLDEKNEVITEDDKKHDKAIASESNSILNITNEKKKIEKDFDKKQIKDENDVYINTSENLIVESGRGNFGFGNKKDMDNLYDKKLDTKSYKDPKIRFDE